MHPKLAPAARGEQGHGGSVGAAGAALTEGQESAIKQLEFPDNKLLLELCGPFDRNLVELERKHAVQILRRGNRLCIFGGAEAQLRSASDLSAAYREIEGGGEPVVGGMILPGSKSDTASRLEEAANDVEEERFTIRTRKKSVRARGPGQRLFVRALRDQEMVFGIGPAGTGKTYLAVAMAVSMLFAGQVRRIVLSRPAVEAGERLGFLPGDMRDKVDPYMQPLYDALRDFLPEKQLARMLDDKQIEIAPLAFMRGRTLSDSFVVLDEAQNASTMQMKMFLTRLGEGSRMAIVGDGSQVDLPAGVTSGLEDAIARLQSIPGIAGVQLGNSDVVRHPLLGCIIDAYGSYPKRG